MRSAHRKPGPTNGMNAVIRAHARAETADETPFPCQITVHTGIIFRKEPVRHGLVLLAPDAQIPRGCDPCPNLSQ
jgi:hypothetical protein